MGYIFLLILGVGIGWLVGWFWAGARARAMHGIQLAEVQGKLAASEKVQAELRDQLRSRDADLDRVRAELSAAQVERATALTKLESAQANLEQQRQLLDDAGTKLGDAFKALSADALNENNTAFLQLAAERLRALQREAQGELAQRQQAIQALVNPLEEALERYGEQIQAMERERQKAYGSLEHYLKTLGETSQKLQLETTNLVTALKRPGVKGRWGELTLRRVVEAAGMSEYCDFVEQPTAETPEGPRRPDLLVNLPGGRSIVIDAKVPLRAYMDAMDANDETQQQGFMLEHASAVRASMKELGSRTYWSQFEEAPNFVVLFLPGESLFSAALEMDRELIVDGIANKVVLATPTTLIACLLVVAYGWQQQKMAENARRIAEAGSDLYGRILKFTEHLKNIREASEQMCQAVNDAIGSFDSRLVPGARKLRELGAGEAAEEIQTPRLIETSLRLPQSEP